MISVFLYLLSIILIISVFYVYLRLANNKIMFLEGIKEKRDFELRELQKSLEESTAKLNAQIIENQVISTEKDRIYLELKVLKINYESLQNDLEQRSRQRGRDDITIEYYAKEPE